MTDRGYDFMESLEKLVKEHPDLLENEIHKHNMTREQRFNHSWKRIHRLMQLRPEIFTQYDPQYWCNWNYYFSENATPIYQH